MGEHRTSDARLAADEQAWLDELVREHAPRLLAYVRRVHGDPTDAEDVVAETFCRAMANIGTIQSTARPGLYLLTTARNLYRDRYRRKTPVGWSTQAWASQPAEPTEPSTRLEQREQNAAVRAAVAELPEHLREVVVLRMSSDLRFEDIAELLHIPLGTALSRMHAALKSLRAKLDTNDESASARTTAG